LNNKEVHERLMNFKIHHKNIKGGKEKKNGALDSARKKKDGSEHSTKNE
jgi:hypothetical protein